MALLHVRALVGAAALVAGGCAAHKPDVMLGYTDHNYFVIEHHDPAHGGRIIGTVCDVDVELDAHRVRDGIVLVGGATDRHNGEESMHYDRSARAWVPSPNHELGLHVEAHDNATRAERHIYGAVGDEGDQIDLPVRMPASHGIDLRLSRERISGRVGMRTFDMVARGDDYVGSLRLEDNSIPFVLRGAAQLWAMPAAAQASILPLLLTCTQPTKVIQMVDLRQSDTPPPSPPRWLAPPQPQPAMSPVPRDLTPADPRRTPAEAAPRGRIAMARDDLR
jgi:hypothetical protein